MSDIAVRVENLSKLYRLGQFVGYKTLREGLTDALSTPFRWLSRSAAQGSGTGAWGSRSDGSHRHGTIWALKDVSFEVKRGEVIGIIGRNGSGKSTLLKVLSRVTFPTEGHVQTRGRVGSLLEVGTGFHPELTGRENIYLNGAIIGMTKAEVKRKFDEIVAFADIDERFIDTPVKRYSSGMYVRLAFAVAAHLETEILLVDEVLAVGDAAFRKKCLGKISDVATEGRTVLFVSHNMQAVTDLCQRCLWIDEGRIIQEGAPQQVVVAYLSSGQPKQLDGVITPDMHVNATGDVYFRRIALLDGNDRPTTYLLFGSPLRVGMELEICRPVKDMRLIVSIERLDGTLISVLHHTDAPKEPLIDAEPGLYEVHMELQLPLMPGGYTLELGAKPAPGYWGSGMSWDWVPRALDFYVEQASAGGYVVLPTKAAIRPLAIWQVEPIQERVQ